MDAAEAYVANWLKQRYPDLAVEYHPHGKNSPPDMVLGGQVAIEVRRLVDAHIENGRVVREIYSEDLRLRDLIARAASSTQALSHDWWLGLSISGNWSEYGRASAAKAARAAFDDLGQTNSDAIEKRLVLDEDGSVQVLDDDDRVPFTERGRATLSIRREREREPADGVGRIKLGTHPNFHWGHCVGERPLALISHAIEEKSRKIAKVRSRHPKWWLILVDRITFLSPEEINPEAIGAVCMAAQAWHQVLLLSKDEHVFTGGAESMYPDP